MDYIHALFIYSGHLLLGTSPVSGISTVQMEDRCGTELSMILEDIYQGKLRLEAGFELYTWFSQSSTPCTIVLESWHHYDRIMFYFEEINLSCDVGYITFHNGGSQLQDALTGLERVCGKETPTGVFMTSGRTLTVTYTMLQMTVQKDTLQLIFTAYHDGICEFNEHRCANKRCIHEDLMCDHHNPCGDNSDCPPETLSAASVAGIIIGSLAGFGVLVSLVAMVICCVISRNRRLKQAHRRTALAVNRQQPCTLPRNSSDVSTGDVTIVTPPYTVVPPIGNQSLVAPLQPCPELQTPTVDVSMTQGSARYRH